ncbi:MAG: DUF4097 domain-containing protein [Treponema sp.]|jgi:DUF4097 and DUF4098 domain-containing protein YvlB|nr:DUF4097 domain-containing protein [Treponema sp.]
MKTAFFIFVFAVFSVFKGYSGGTMEAVNIQEIELHNVQNINILYNQWENVSVYNSPSEKFIIKEYMNRNSGSYYAQITNSGNTLTLEDGERPFTPVINTFSARLEVYIPRSYRNTVTIKTRHGKIEIPNELICAKINIENASGNIVINVIEAENIDLKTTGGNITINEVKGILNTNTSSGRVKVNAANGAITAKTRSGSIVCTAGKDIGNVLLETSSGGITLNLPENLAFGFSARTSGRLSAPFSGKLNRSESDRHLMEGIIGENPDREINVKAGSWETIRIRWAE